MQCTALGSVTVSLGGSEDSAAVLNLVYACVAAVCTAGTLELVRRQWWRSRNNSSGRDVLILPVYIYTLACFALVYVCQGIVAWFVSQIYRAGGKLEDSSRLNEGVGLGFLYGLYRAMMEIVAVVLAQHSFGTRAIVRAGAIAGAWMLLCWAGFAVVWYYNHGDVAVFFVFINVTLVVFYGAFRFAPAKVLFRRPAASVYAGWSLVIHACFVLATSLKLGSMLETACWVNMACQFVNYGVGPVILYKTLSADSLYWQYGWITAEPPGAETAAVPSSSLSVTMPGTGVGREGSVTSAINAPLIARSFCLSAATARELAIHLDDVRTLPILNHAFVSLSPNRVLGDGGSAKVFAGTWNSTKVAIKMCYCMEITPEAISAIVAEGAALGGIHDESVVEVYGFAVAPPSVCLVMELCARSVRKLLDDEFSTLDHRRKLELCIGCCKGVLCLHSQKTPIKHNDLKAANFLQSTSGVVKIADLGLAIAGSGTWRAEGTREDRGDQICNWLAPEVARALLERGPIMSVYTTHSDIYSLASVFWEIFTGGIPLQYFDLGRLNELAHDKGVKLPNGLTESTPPKVLVRIGVAMLGLRPAMPWALEDGVKALLNRMWSTTPTDRPNAQTVLAELTSILHSEFMRV